MYGSEIQIGIRCNAFISLFVILYQIEMNVRIRCSMHAQTSGIVRIQEGVSVAIKKKKKKMIIIGMSF